MKKPLRWSWPLTKFLPTKKFEQEILADLRRPPNSLKLLWIICNLRNNNWFHSNCYYFLIDEKLWMLMKIVRKVMWCEIGIYRNVHSNSQVSSCIGFLTTSNCILRQPTSKSCFKLLINFEHEMHFNLWRIRLEIVRVWTKKEENFPKKSFYQIFFVLGWTIKIWIIILNIEFTDF